ncbi:hypothetical protein SAMN04487846_1321 [Microbacterium sp. cf046]|uniref:protealysin inhibitor emfourin n=1 Tax=Microbacterium sp. cf046 TaxID=1761803 RepID=UPI0008F12C73|nr:protealysin inhibitor emfourin [Microbacterium sp. cf046]SFR99902.1 hypothetical protein SAMN04487846_1321 [Microbacterium sp. cf046]
MTDPTAPDGRTPDHESARTRRGSDGEQRTDDGIIAVAVTVTRTGGFAGLRRTWHAQPDTAETPQWIALIDECPWDAADPGRPIAPNGADLFMWRVDARCGDAARAAALADPEVQGPWRDLIDAVRSAETGGERPGSPR